MNIPEYTGQPLSLLARTTAPESDIVLWLYGRTHHGIKNTIEQIDKLVAAGYEQVPREKKHYRISELLSQLCNTALIADEMEGGKGATQIWAHSKDVAHVKKHPVTLAFTLEIEKDTGADAIPMLQFLPPPHMGEFALIAKESPEPERAGELAHYTVSQLPELAQARWKALNMAIRSLASPGIWIPHAYSHPYCADELAYLRITTDYRTLTLKGKRADREQAQALLTLLEEAHTEVAKMRQSWLKLDWLLQWREIKRMAQELAADYYAYHQSTIPPIENKPVPSIAEAFRMVGNASVTDMFTSQPFLAYPTAAISRKAALSDNNVESMGEWTEERGEKENEVIVSYRHSRPSGDTYVQFREEVPDLARRDAALANLWRQTIELSDIDSDVSLAMAAQMMKGVKDEQGFTWITTEQLLNYRGIKPKRNQGDLDNKYTGGHRWEDIETIARCIKRMENVFIKVQEMEIIDDSAPGKKRGKPRTTINRMSRLFIFGDTINHTTLPLDGPSKTVTIAWQYRESSWMVPFLEGSNRYTGILFQKVLNYDPYHEKWEKRLSKHLMVWLRTNASHKTKPGITVNELLTECRLDVEEDRPQRTLERFEKAMNRIQADGLLTWHYKDDIALPARKWLPTWLQQQIVVEDPPVIKSQYMTIEATATAIREENRIAEKSKKTRGKRGQ